MNGEALNRLIEIAREGCGIEAVGDENVPMSAVPLHDARPKIHEPATLMVHTLTGLVGYVNAQFDDDVDVVDAAILIESPDTVTVISSLLGDHNQRCQFAMARVEPVIGISGGMGFHWGDFVPPDEFTIALNTLFTGAGDRDAVVRLAGNVTAEAIAKLLDDGFSQEIQQRRGVALADSAEVPNPLMLAPYRTFREIEQPVSPFLLRFQGGADSPVTCALFPADAGMWRMAAIKSISEFLTGAIEPTGMLIIG